MSRIRKNLETLSVRNKVRFAVITIIGLFMFSGLMSIIGSLNVSSQFRRFYKESYVNATVQMEIRKDLQYAGKHMLWSVSVSDEVQIREHMQMVATAIERMEANIATLHETYHNEEHLEKLDAVWAEFMDMHTQLIEYVNTDDKLAGIMLYVGDYENVVNEMQTLLTEIGDEAGAAARREYNTGRNSSSGSSLLLLILLGGSVGVGIYMVRALTEVITKPVNEMKMVAEQLAEGNLSIEVKHESGDEFGSLADSFRKTCGTLQAIISDLSYVLEELKNGNFDVDSKDCNLYVGDFAKIINDVRETAVKQSKTLSHINQAVEQVAFGAEQLASSAQDIAEGSSEQSGAVKELQSAIESIADVSAKSTERVAATVNDVRTAVREAERGKNEAAELVRAMELITETSREIENISEAIEDIASQTNLLSLNASIEAARAGEAGRGFAVVAEQIGKLASDSAQSAVQTRDLIGKALVEIQNGSRIVENTTDIMTKTIRDMENFETTVNGMAEAFRAQSDMIRDVESSVDKISLVAQNNSATAEETSAVSEELSAQAVDLGELTGQFTFREEE